MIAILLTGISDKDSGCRWTAAKGLGRLNQRLPRDLAREVIGFVLDQFSEGIMIDPSGRRDLSSVNENTWHGACLTLAELARRGLLPQDLLSRCLESVMEAHRLDIRRGSHSVGSNVRDAACYVFWSFARAYPASVFQDHALSLAHQLVVASVFDREINVRRASSAAFQEFVGRLQLFPEGIQVVVKVDYFAVGNVSNAYLRASVQVAKFPEYRTALFSHLYTVCLKHWDINIRRLGALALGSIAALESEEACTSAINFLIEQSASLDLATRHGAILGIGAICRAASLGRLLEIGAEPVSSVFCRLTSNELSSFGSEVLLEGACLAMRDLCRIEWPLSPQARSSFQRIINTCLYRKENHLQEVAATCLGEYVLKHPLGPEELEQYPF
ncbi:hypothetical protein DSO57_1033884 [Entomophthora muscae]|uniref:Uncharacterized protein n=1 Tax=Entomophthora muscae TaxID=34485 RepID=A0ACC2RQV0_9FUNG|nr:hypothetical protein DSO57_1033884 [Entomophthora muscae]